MNMQQRRSGVLLHLTSLPGPHGIGDLGPDAYAFVDWLCAAGQSVWQWLPTTPIGPGYSPYQSVSAFAGSPLMVALEPLVQQGWLTAQDIDASVPADHAGLGDRRDDLVYRVNFGQVVPARMALLRKAWSRFMLQAGRLQREQLAQWQEQQQDWLGDYSLFMALEASQQGRPWWHWPQDLRDRQPQALQAAQDSLAEDIGFWCFVQWCFDAQCRALKTYANQRGIAIMGDLPIFIAHHSADCWTRPDLYFLDEARQPTVVAGCPPDAFAADGQRWGNPLYRWDRMAAEGHAWWIQRLCRLLTQADLLRIDHFRGFAGYYEIPATSPTARDGRWVPGPGRTLFDALRGQLGDLPIVAEDLGLITPDVTELRDACGFPGMKILSQAFSGDSSHDFLPHNYGRASVVYTGTHDNDTCRGWWQSASDHERHCAGAYLATSAHDIHWAMIRAASNSVAFMAIHPMQDVLGLDGSHRMNLPGTIGQANWSWRFHWGMVGNEPQRVLGLITELSGRSAARTAPGPHIPC